MENNKKLKDLNTVAFITIGFTALNMALMANGIKTMPLIADQVYQSPLLAATMGGIIGLPLGNVLGVAYVKTTDQVKSGIKSLREKFFDDKNNENKPTI